MKITLLHPSRGRPEKARATYDEWMANASGDIEIEHILSLDFSDPRHEDYGMIQRPGEAPEYKPFGDNSKTLIDHNTCVVEATNQAAKVSTGDILVYLSDDFKCPPSWDLLIVNQFDEMNIPALLKVDDCLQPFDKDVLTIPIMNRALYGRLGYFWHHWYKSMYVDQDLYWVCANNNWIIFAPQLKFEHQHYSVGKATKDRTYAESDKNWNQGKETYHRRRQQGFSI